MNQAQVAELNEQFEFKLIPLELIDEPQRPERETMDPQALAELSLNICDVGLIKPLIVLPRGDRFEVDAGHRRLLACRIGNYSPVPCRVKVNERVSALAIMIHENAHTESVNAVEEARCYAEFLVSDCNSDVDVLCSKLRRGRAFVEGRLNLLTGYPRVVDALANSRITIGVAEQLNRVKDPNRLLLLLDQATSQGATVRTVIDWVRDANMADPIELPSDDFVDPAFAPVSINVQPGNRCFFCESGKHSHTLQFVYLHPPCMDMIRKALSMADPDAAPPQ